jgi:glycine betaine/choline ABC-type transport system substrate-binding protein
VIDAAPLPRTARWSCDPGRGRGARRLVGVVLLAGLPWPGAAGCGRAPATIVVGSKNFTEQIVLAELVAQQVEERAGLKVERRVNLGGTLLCHQGLVSGELDVYVEYTGTALTAILGEPPRRDPRAVYGRVRDLYRERFDLEWTEPLGFDNTFAMAIRGADARRLGLTTLSEAVPHAARWRAGVGYEFMERADGWAGLVETYGLVFARPPMTMELGLIYRALKEGEVDIIAANATDGVIEALDLAILRDDRGYFPPYEAAPVVRGAALRQHPALRRALAELGGILDEARMRRLNHAVDGDKRAVREVVKEFLGEVGARRGE